MTVLIASELTDAEVALLTRADGPALRTGALRLMAAAAGLRPGPTVASARSARSAVCRCADPGNTHDRPGVLHVH